MKLNSIFYVVSSPPPKVVAITLGGAITYGGGDPLKR